MGACGWTFVCLLVQVSICDTYNAAGPHSPSGMWDFQVENRPHRGRRAGTSSREWGEKKKRGTVNDVRVHSNSGRMFIFI